MSGKGEQQPEIRVTDHSIVRFLERTGQVDVEALRREILSERIVKQALVLGDGKYPTSRGMIAVIKDKTVVTVEVNGG